MFFGAFRRNARVQFAAPAPTVGDAASGPSNSRKPPLGDRVLERHFQVGMAGGHKPSSGHGRKLQADDANEDHCQTGDTIKIGPLFEQQHARDDGAEGTNTRPYRISCPERHRFQRQAEKDEAQAERHGCADARPQPHSAIGIFEAERPGDLHQAGQQESKPTDHVGLIQLPAPFSAIAMHIAGSRDVAAISDSAPADSMTNLNLRPASRAHQQSRSPSYPKSPSHRPASNSANAIASHRRSNSGCSGRRAITSSSSSSSSRTI